MKETHRFSLLTFIAVLVIFCSVFAVPAYARDEHHGDRHRGRHRGYNHHDRYPYGSVTLQLPRGYIELGLGSNRYYYHGGLFYRFNQRRYVVVPPPTGVVIYQIPDGWHTVVIDGVTYYVYNGIYYSRVPQGYQVVQPPTPVIVQPAIVSAPDVPEQAQEEFVVNIPNKKGGYVTVVIKRSGAGFVGPQGEYYDEFPKVAQLQVMYVN